MIATIKEKCGIQDELQLAEAFTRRALACDLMQLCSFEKMDRWRKHLLAQLSLHPPPRYSRVSMEQLLRTDRAAFVRMAELLGSLKSCGKTPVGRGAGRPANGPSCDDQSGSAAWP